MPCKGSQNNQKTNVFGDKDVPKTGSNGCSLTLKLSKNDHWYIGDGEEPCEMSNNKAATSISQWIRFIKPLGGFPGRLGGSIKPLGGSFDFLNFRGGLFREGAYSQNVIYVTGMYDSFSVLSPNSLSIQHTILRVKYILIQCALPVITEGVVAQWCNPLTLQPE